MNAKRYLAGRDHADCPPVADDPFLAVLEAADLDDEPVTDDDHAAAQAGWDAYVRGESTSWEDVRRPLRDVVDAAQRPKS